MAWFITIQFIQDGSTIASSEGSFTSKDYYGENSLVNLIFPDPVKLEPEVIYTARVDLEGTNFTIGTEGQSTVMGQGGVVFNIYSPGLTESDPESGPIAKFLYSR